MKYSCTPQETWYNYCCLLRLFTIPFWVNGLTIGSEIYRECCGYSGPISSVLPMILLSKLVLCQAHFIYRKSFLMLNALWGPSEVSSLITLAKILQVTSSKVSNSQDKFNMTLGGFQELWVSQKNHFILLFFVVVFIRRMKVPL